MCNIIGSLYASLLFIYITSFSLSYDVFVVVPQHLMSSQGGIPPDSLSTLGREPPLIGQPSSALGELGPSYDDNILESHVSGFESHVSGQGVSQGMYVLCTLIQLNLY